MKAHAMYSNNPRPTNGKDRNTQAILTIDGSIERYSDIPWHTPLILPLDLFLYNLFILISPYMIYYKIYYPSISTDKSKAISIISIKVFSLSSGVVASEVTILSLTVRIERAFFPNWLAFI